VSTIEDALAFQLTAAGIPFEREVRFHPTRRWRWDFVISPSVPPGHKLAVEVQGGLWMRRGGHTTGAGIGRDIEKHNFGVALSWVILYGTKANIESGELLALIEEMLASRG
jgi:hypothetical protein